MATMIEEAVLGFGKAMREVYALNKNEVYAFCRVFVSEKEAAAMVEDVLKNGFSLAKKKGVTSEDAFTRLLKTEVAKRCAALVLDGKAPQAENNTPKAKFVRACAVFNGSVAKGKAHLEKTLAELTSYQRFAYVCAAAGGLNYAEIGEAMGEREAIARYCVETAAYVMSRMAAGEVRTDQIPSLYKKEAEDWELPEANDAACREFIAKNTVRQTPLWKIFVPIVAAAAVVALVVLLVVAIGKKNPTFTTTDGTGTTNSTLATKPPVTDDEVSIDLTKTYYADIDIQDHGTITVKLEADDAPITVDNFVNLAQSGFYNGLTFHRIIEDFMMQGGCPQGNGLGGADKDIVGEFPENGYNNTLKHTRGAISMARSSHPDSGSSQFFIVHKTSDFLDGKYAVFGYVTEGMDIVDTICEEAEPIDGDGAIARSQQPVINSIKIRVE